MTFFSRSSALYCAFSLLLALSAPAQDRQPDGKGAKPLPTVGTAVSVNATSTPITYHGGPIMLGTTNVYYIFYGNWTGNTATTILPDLAANIGGSPYFNINTTYTDSASRAVTNAVHYVGSTTDAYSRGTTLADGDIQTIVTSAINSGKLGSVDPNGIYFVLASADVKESSGFCTQYCGWHTYARINGYQVKYAFIGNGDQCPNSCQYRGAKPNGNAGADGMASVIAHELEETVTDPLLNGWYDASGAENADKCAWTFGTILTSANGSIYNMTLGSRQFLIQQNLVNASGGYCALSYAAAAPTPPTADSASPNSGSGASQVFTMKYSSGSGYAYLKDSYVLFNSSVNGANACFVVYDAPSGGLYLYNDTGTGTLGPITPGAGATLANSQCTLTGTGSSVSGAGNTLTMALNLSFNAAFGGAQTMFLYSADKGGQNSGWQNRGTWTVPASATAPTADSVTPSSGSGASQTFTFSYSSVNGYGYLSDVYALFNSSIYGAGACFVVYDRPANGFYLYTDAGNAVLGPITPGSAGTVSNSQCTLNGAGSSLSGVGPTLTMTLNLTFSASFSGTRNIFLYATDRGGLASGWQNRGSWIVP